ncbi:MAG: addiction module protein [Planctomycetaceae bacterium]|nr:addiction module protein [Planctomycetaceae bacterium]
MAATMRELGIDQWSNEDRIQLWREIWDSLLITPENFFTAEQREEVRQCIEDHDRNPDEGTPWEEVPKNLESELKQ